MAINEILKSTALASVSGNAGALQDAGYVTVNTLRQVLYELFGTGQSGFTLPAGFTGGTFPAGLSATGTLPMVVDVDATTLNSPTGATPNLKSFVLPAGTLSTSGFRGVRIKAWGSFANNASAKTVLVKFGATTLVTVTATVSTTNSWAIEAEVYVRTSTTQIAVALGQQGDATPTFNTKDSAPGETLANAITIQCAGTQTTAADIIQDGLIIDLIP